MVEAYAASSMGGRPESRARSFWAPTRASKRWTTERRADGAKGCRALRVAAESEDGLRQALGIARRHHEPVHAIGDDLGHPAGPGRRSPARPWPWPPSPPRPGARRGWAGGRCPHRRAPGAPRPPASSRRGRPGCRGRDRPPAPPAPGRSGPLPRIVSLAARPPSSTWRRACRATSKPLLRWRRPTQSRRSGSPGLHMRRGSGRHASVSTPTGA